MRPGGNEPGPDGDGKCRTDDEPMPGDGARLGGVARPNPESESEHVRSLILDKKKKHTGKEKKAICKFIIRLTFS